MKPFRAALVLFVVFLSQVSAQNNTPPTPVTLHPNPSRVIGQDAVTLSGYSPNLVEGREFYSPQGLALDTSVNPPALYVSDTQNNRVLGFHSAAAFANGQKADIVLGQPDFNTTLPAGPNLSTTPPTGMTSPTGVAVDAHGNVYVIDASNSRILRYLQPFTQMAPAVPDLVIGQPSFSTALPNQGVALTASTLSFLGPKGALPASLTFDASGNLWVADSANNRALRFNANVLGVPAVQGPAADLVIGQSNLTSNGYSPLPDPLNTVTSFLTPSGIAFDSAGRLFIAESTSMQPGRILMWTPPFQTGQPASRILGVNPNETAPVSAEQLAPAPSGLFAAGPSIGVVDTANSRILVYPPVEQWTPDTTYQTATEVAGQPDFSSGAANQGQPTSSAATLSFPGAAAFFNSELYIADSGNNRVIVMPQSGSSFASATRVLGQDAMNLNSPNLVEGREFDFAGAGVRPGDAGIAVDLTSDTPHLYVADTYNNRILGFRDLRNIAAGAKADIVIGQPDFQQTLINYPGNNASTPSASSLFGPAGLAVDANGDLYVADAGNGRVLRFPQPFANYTAGLMEQANLVIGQPGFNSARITDATSQTMAAPYGLAFTHAGGLLVSDLLLNRVLYFVGQPSELTSGMSASLVFGQQDFTSSGAGTNGNQLSAPHHIAVDSADRLFVADTGNARVSIFDSAPAATSGATAGYFITQGLPAPRGMYINPNNDELWVADGNTGFSARYPAYSQLVAANGLPNAALTDLGGPLALVEDGTGELFVADSASRVVIYYPELAVFNAGNFLSQNVVAPGMITALFSQGTANQFGAQSSAASSLPLPTSLNGVQVLFNGAPVPLFYAGPTQINFQVPMGAPQSGMVPLQVVEPGTGRLLGDTVVEMQAIIPGLFVLSGDGTGTAAALNQDNTVNGQGNFAFAGDVIQLFGTGQGFIAGAPDDGAATPAALPTPTPPRVIIGTGYVPDENIQYSGLAPGQVGVWQINVLIPSNTITTINSPTQVIVVQNGVASGGTGIGRFVQIYVKQKPKK